ncbi:MAG TPA: FtsQ-type POTRA domain-containing protein [Candidatus Limnocylindrales bacterium]|nr:FtsQ-type POTRA domain-containing protein [Candidatus Limnocylindrales bacterium]
MKAANRIKESRPPDAALGRATRGLVGPARGSRRQRGGGSGPKLPKLTGLTGVSGLRGLAAIRGRPGAAGHSAAGRRRRGVARLVTPARAAGLLGMLASGFLLTFVTGPSAFALTRTDAPALQWTADEAVHEALALPSNANVFRLDTAPLEASLEALPGISSADVQVTLPDGVVVVTIQEREAILAWQAGGNRLLVDRQGVIFASVTPDAALPAGVAVVEDRRTGADEQLAIGARLDPVDLDVATRLGSLEPPDVGSAAPHLRVRVTDADGFLVFVDKGWTAVFGFYSPATRAASIIPGQVRLLRSFLIDREATVARVILASETDGTFVPKATPKPTKK